MHPSFRVGLRGKQVDVALSQLDFYAAKCLITFMKADFFHHIYKILLTNGNVKDVVVCVLGLKFFCHLFSM